MSSGELDLLLRHGYALILALVFLEHIGLPIPGAPLLLAAGALAGTGQLDFATALLAALLGCGLSDAFWFEVGRRRGIDVLRQLCRLSSAGDSCLDRTEDAFARRPVLDRLAPLSAEPAATRPASALDGRRQ
jgi:membrane protein DedA with SNARE-associated domain